MRLLHESLGNIDGDSLGFCPGGVLTNRSLLHVTTLVDWPKHIKSRSGGCLERHGDCKPNRKYNRELFAIANCCQLVGTK